MLILYDTAWFGASHMRMRENLKTFVYSSKDSKAGIELSWILFLI